MYGRPAAVCTMLALVALAGCTSDEAPDGPTPTPTPTPADRPNETPEPTPMTRDLYLGAGSLDAQPGASGALTVPGTWAGIAVAALGFEPATFTAERLELPAIVPAGRYTANIFFEAVGPVVGPGLYDFALWFGSDVNAAETSIVNVGPLTAPSVFEVEFDIDLRAPLYVPAGGALEIMVSSATIHEESGILQLLYGADNPSRVNLTWQPLLEDPLAGLQDQELTTFSGTIQAGVFPSCPSTCRVTESIDVPEDAAGLVVSSTASSALPTAHDLDLLLKAGSQDLGHEGAPSSDGTIILAGPLIEEHRGTTLTLDIILFVGQEVSYDVRVGYWADSG